MEENWRRHNSSVEYVSMQSSDILSVEIVNFTCNRLLGNCISPPKKRRVIARYYCNCRSWKDMEETYDPSQLILGKCVMGHLVWGNHQIRQQRPEGNRESSCHPNVRATRASLSEGNVESPRLIPSIYQKSPVGKLQIAKSKIRETSY